MLHLRKFHGKDVLGYGVLVGHGEADQAVMKRVVPANARGRCNWWWDHVEAGRNPCVLFYRFHVPKGYEIKPCDHPKYNAIFCLFATMSDRLINITKIPSGSLQVR